MSERTARAVMVLGLSAVLAGAPAAAQVRSGGLDPTMPEMWSRDLGDGWRIAGMGQVFPVVTFGGLGQGKHPSKVTGWYLTQPAAMAGVSSPGGGLSLRTTLNFEGVTQEGGELTYGAWGEGFIDKRHPHTLLHEFVLSLNRRDSTIGALSMSAGKGFAPFGTDDPMSRPGLKYPTNHHLSQVLERWFVSGALLRGGWGVEAGVFGGAEPEAPYDFGNIDSFGDSWSVRLSKRWPAPAPGWELSLSHADVAEPHEEESVRTRLWNGALRYEAERTLRYGLVEASIAEGPGADDLFSVLGEARLSFGRHQPYARVEYSTRPEYEREPGSDGFFRYDHDSEPVGSTRWFITTVAYEYAATDPPLGLWPFIEFQHSRVRGDRGGIEPSSLFGTNSIWSLTVGARVLLGGAPMRMGIYGVLDPMTSMLGTGPGMGPM